jgi:hypothetical protein
MSCWRSPLCLILCHFDSRQGSWSAGHRHRILEEHQSPAHQRSHDFLIGAWVRGGGPTGRDVHGFTQPLRTTEEDKVRAIILGRDGLTAIRQLLFTFVGPGQVWIIARVDIDDSARGAQVKSLVRGIESDLKEQGEEIFRVDVVAIGEATGADS